MEFSLFWLQFFILTVLIVHFLIHSGLIITHKRYVLAHQNKVPADFKTHIALADHQKSAQYVAKSASLNQISLVLDLLVFIAFTYAGGINAIHSWLNGWISLGIISDVLMVLIFMTLIGFINLPLGIYKTFVVEQNFGFNKQTPKDYCIDLVKSYCLSLVLVSLLLFGIFYLMVISMIWWIWAALFVMVFNLLVSYLYPTFIAPIFNQFKPIEKGEFSDAIHDLLNQCQFKNKGVFVMDGSRRSSHLNAYFTGFGANKRIVLFDTLMEKLSVAELKSVLAHELGHYHHKHIQKRITVLLIQVLFAFYLLNWVHANPLFYQAFGVNQISNGALIVLLSLFLPIIFFFIQPVSSHFSRKHEFEADAFAAKKTAAQDLISALLKLYKENSATLTPHPLYSQFFDSHPPAKQRIDQLKHAN